MPVNLIVNVVTILLLSAALVYGLRLSKQIQAFLQSRAELGAMFRTFDRTIAEAREHMRNLRQAADESEKKLRESIDRATIMADDLAGVADRAENVFTVLERARARGEKPLVPSPSSKVTFEDEKDDAKPLTDAQRAKKQAVLERLLQKVANARQEEDGAEGAAPSKKISKAV
ncbi:MAG: DUF6468 domain-containing protein [Rickettsiales bacterium]